MNDFEPLDPATPCEWSTIRVSGDDASAFLQGQLTADVQSRASVTLLLTPASAVITAAMLSYEDDAISLTVPSEVVDAALQRLRRFVLRSKCSFEVASGVRSGRWATIGDQVAEGLAGPNEFARELTPHSFGQSFVERHISFTKGCFTGQELVGRLDARGANVPFRLAQFWSPTAQEAHELVASFGPSGGSQGLTTVVANTDGVSGLAIVHRTLGDGEINDVRVRTVA